MKRVGFRTRLLIVLALFAAVPALLVAVAYNVSVAYLLPELSATEPFERLAQTGLDALAVAEQGARTPDDRARIAAHRDELRRSLINANRLALLIRSSPSILGGMALVAVLLIGIASTRVGGHLSRQLSRPLQELVTWTEMIARGEKLPDVAEGRGAPEFEVLRQRMRLAARELGKSRERALEAERLRASRESARQVAHELKNVLMPIRFAIARLQKGATPQMLEPLDVLETETRRLEEIARSFSSFGKLPEGPLSEVDVGEMVSYTSKAVVPPQIQLDLQVERGLPHLRGHHDALTRAFSNVLLNAVDASDGSGVVHVRARRSSRKPESVEIEVEDNGRGIPADQLSTIWDPYVTSKKGGTGLGLAITRQTVEAHGGSVEARSEPGAGTVITFILPYQKPAAPDAAV
jgi:signal transduction histidine kinase